VFVSTLLAVALAAPVPKAKPSELYFPTVEGTKRVMTISSGGQTSEITETYTKVLEKDGKYTVTISRELRGGTVTNDYEVSDKGVFLPASPGANADPEPMLKLPAKEGDTWIIDMSRRGQGVTGTVTVGKEEEVEVLAGKFKAIAVTIETSQGGCTVSKTKAWYAAGVGVVKQVSERGGTERVHELKEFTPGQAK